MSAFDPKRTFVRLDANFPVGSGEQGGSHLGIDHQQIAAIRPAQEGTP